MSDDAKQAAGELKADLDRLRAAADVRRVIRAVTDGLRAVDPKAVAGFLSGLFAPAAPGGSDGKVYAVSGFGEVVTGLNPPFTHRSGHADLYDPNDPTQTVVARVPIDGPTYARPLAAIGAGKTPTLAVRVGVPAGG